MVLMCISFFMCRGTGDGAVGDISVESRVLATILSEMDGIDGPDSGKFFLLCLKQ